MNKASIRAGNASIRNSGDALNTCERGHKYEKRVTTGGNQDNIGQMFIGKENRERESGKMANIHSDVGRETAADPSQQKTPDDFRPGFRDAARSEILNRFAHFRRSFQIPQLPQILIPGIRAKTQRAHFFHVD